MSENSNSKLDKISEDLTVLKVSMAISNVTQSSQKEILDRLTSSVEEHVKRTNALEELVMLTREQQNKDKSFVNGAFWAVSGLLAIALAILALHK